VSLPRWFWLVAALALFLGELPYLFGWAIQPAGTLYLGVHSNYDDHAVYAAWMKQAQEGKFFFENRFTVDPQPGLTVNLYFWAAGTLSRLTGIPLASHIAKVVFGLLFLIALYRLARRLSTDEFVQKVAFSTAVFGAGVGWLLWRRYGAEGPIDIWQPEAFTFPSLMTNGLFCAALWLICVIWNKLLDARDSWRPVLAGSLAVLALTNFHTYDTLTIAIVSMGFLASQIASGKFSTQWLVRAVVIAAGAIPSLLWFLHVRSLDPVFRQRAETGTYSPRFFDVLAGYGPLLALALIGFIYWQRGRVAAVLASGLLLALALWQQQSGYAADSLWLDIGPWLLIAGAGVAVCAAYRPETPIAGLLFSWVLLGLLALYYPGLFQRKLAMGLSIPIGLGAGLVIAHWLAKNRSLAFAGVALVSVTSAKWIQREMQMAAENISITTMQRVYWDKDTATILEYLRRNRRDDDCVIARPGQPVPIGDDPAHPIRYEIGLADVNPVMTGWAGIKTYVGHWSETPNITDRRSEVIRWLFRTDTASEATARALVEKAKATYIIVPTGAVAAALRVPPLSFYLKLGHTVYEGEDLALVALR
jgi:hypothetical protein